MNILIIQNIEEQKDIFRKVINDHKIAYIYSNNHRHISETEEFRRFVEDERFTELTRYCLISDCSSMQESWAIISQLYFDCPAMVKTEFSEIYDYLSSVYGA